MSCHCQIEAQLSMRAILTVATRSHLRLALTLAKSLRAVGESAPIHVLVADALHQTEVELCARADQLCFLGLDDLNVRIPEAPRWYFTPHELCSNVKAFGITHLLNEGYTEVVYLDADIYINNPLTLTWKAFDSAEILFTPHHLSPPPTNLSYTSEAIIGDTGVFNAGFIGVSSGKSGKAFANWLSESGLIYGFCNRKNGMFGDQKLLSQALQYWPQSISILQNPGDNVAWWNLHERLGADSAAQLEPAEVVYFHFSGFDPSNPKRFCSYLPPQISEGFLERFPDLREICLQYSQLLQSSATPYDTEEYGFANYKGIRLDSDLRQLIYRNGDLDSRDPGIIYTLTKRRLRAIKRAVVSALRR